MKQSLCEPRTARTVSGLMTFLLICLFAGLSLFLVVLGAGVYRSVARTAAQNNELRATVSYVSGKIRARESTDSLYVTELEGAPALAISTRYEDETYTTYIYCMDGALRELFMSEDAEVTAADGMPLCALSAFVPEMNDGVCRITLTDARGETRVQRVALRTEDAL